MSRTVLRASFRSRAIALIFRFCTKYARRTLAIVSTVTIPLLTPGANHALGAGLPPRGGGQIWTPITPKEGSKLHAAQHLSVKSRRGSRYVVPYRINLRTTCSYRSLTNALTL